MPTEFYYEIGRARLAAFRAHVAIPKKRIHRVFNFNTTNLGAKPPRPKVPLCLTAGCLLGELPGFDPAWRFVPPFKEPTTSMPTPDDSTSLEYVTEEGEVLKGFKGAKRYFGLKDDEADHLFLPNWQQPNRFNGPGFLPGSASIELVLQNVDGFLALFPEVEQHAV